MTTLDELVAQAWVMRHATSRPKRWSERLMYVIEDAPEFGVPVCNDPATFSHGYIDEADAWGCAYALRKITWQQARVRIEEMGYSLTPLIVTCENEGYNVPAYLRIADTFLGIIAPEGVMS